MVDGQQHPSGGTSLLGNLPWSLLLGDNGKAGRLASRDTGLACKAQVPGQPVATKVEQVDSLLGWGSAVVPVVVDRIAPPLVECAVRTEGIVVFFIGKGAGTSRDP